MPPPTAFLAFPMSPKVCMLQSYHQNAEQFEIMFNKTKYDALPAKMKATDRVRGRRGLGRHVVEGDRPLLEGLRRDADQGQGQVLQNPGLRCCRGSSRSSTRSRRRSQATTDVQRDRRIAAAIRASARSSGISTPIVDRRMAYNHYFAKAAAKPAAPAAKKG